MLLVRCSHWKLLSQPWLKLYIVVDMFSGSCIINAIPTNKQTKNEKQIIQKVAVCGLLWN